MRNEIGYGRTPEEMRRYVVKPAPVALPGISTGKKRKGYVVQPPVEDAPQKFYRPDNRFSYRVRDSSGKTTYGPERSTPIR